MIKSSKKESSSNFEDVQRNARDKKKKQERKKSLECVNEHILPPKITFAEEGTLGILNMERTEPRKSWNILVLF